MRTQETTRQTARPSTSKIWRFNGVAAAVAVALGGLAAVPGQAFAAAPAANSVIGNTATATYTDASLINRSATSNTVQTTVQQVGSFTLTANNNKFVAPGGQVVYAHTLTNTGNGSDSYTLSTAQSGADSFNLTGFAIYADTDGNGVADNAVDLTGTAVALASGGTFKFVVVGSAPGTVVATNTAITTVTATSGFNAATDTDTDTATVTADAVIAVTKSASVITGPIGTVIEYTLTYTNTGNNTATGVTITDAIPQGVGTGGLKYLAGTGVWSGTVAALTDLNAENQSGITYEVTGTAPTQTVNVVIASVAPNVSGTIKFQVEVDDEATGVDGNGVAAPGILTNTGNYIYNNGTAPVLTQPTNSVDFLVTQSAAVAANDSNTLSTLVGVNDIVEVASAGQGTTVSFDNYIWNNGNGTDTFNITYANAGINGFPVGTSFQLFQADGVNVLQDTNSDGVPDTGLLASGASYKVVLKATLPSNATGSNFNVVKRATSAFDPTKTDTVTDNLAAITVNVVDLSNNTTPTLNANGAGGAATAGTPTNGGAAWNAPAINPGTSTTFTLLIENKVGAADNYNLSADSDAGFSPLNLPAGWTVTFRNDASGIAADCSTTGATITNTGTINAGASKLVCAVVSVPATQVPVTASPIYFQALSPVTGAGDTKLDAVTVNTFRNLQMISDNTGQVFPSGSVVYTHILTNIGNVTEGLASGNIVFPDTGINTGASFSTVFYFDSNNNGTLDVYDQALTATNFQDVTDGTLLNSSINYTGAGANITGLAPTESVRIFAKVQSPASATPGTLDVATVTANVSGTISGVAAPTDPVNTDTTNVIGGQIRLFKTQALDANCDGIAETAYDDASLSALPGACIMYRIVAINNGVSAVSNVVISDATPLSYTTMFATPLPIVNTVTVDSFGVVLTSTPTAITVSYPTVLPFTGLVQTTITSMNGGEAKALEFSVKIDN